MWLPPGAPALLNGHHDAQKNIITGLRARLTPLNGAPDNVVPVNCSRSSAPATGALAVPNTKVASRPISNHFPHDRFRRATIVPPCALLGACGSHSTMEYTSAAGPWFRPSAPK